MLRCIKNRKAYLIKAALYGCLRHLNDGTDREKPMSVCLAITKWAHVEPTPFKEEAKEAACAYIANLIKPATYVHHWLAREHGIVVKSTKQIQAYRKAWVLHMINEMFIYEKEKP